MNAYQALRRVKNILRGIKWAGTGDSVFAAGSVFASEGPAEDVLDHVRMPSAWISAGSANHDDEQPGLYDSDIHVVTLVNVAGDMYGEGVILGRNRLAVTSSEGRGLHEIEAEMLSNLAHLDASQQFRLMLKAASAALAAPAGPSGFHATRRYTLKALLTIKAQHLHPRNVAVVESGGDVTISWDAPDDVTNLTGYIVRRASGNVPAFLPTQGTDVPWTSGLSVVDTAPSSGTYVYSVFAAYDDEGGSLEFDVSDYDDDEIVVP